MSAISTYKTFLMKGTGSTPTWAKLIDIKDFPDLGGEPEMIETTTLSDSMQTFIPGIQANGAMAFTANYNATDYATIKALEGTETDLAVWFGGTEAAGVVTPDGSAGKFAFKGFLSVFVAGGGVNEAVDMTVTVAPSTPITFAAS